MASTKTIAGTLAYLHELYPSREIGLATAEAWSMVFADWSDDELQACAMRAAATPGRTFFPTPGEIAVFRVPAAIVDGAKILRQIEKLSIYNPNSGMIAPDVGTVRRALGDVIADAYASAGSGRCFSDDETTRSIAQREFQKSAEKYAAMPTEVRPLIESGVETRRITGKTKPEALAAIVARALPADHLVTT